MSAQPSSPVRSRLARFTRLVALNVAILVGLLLLVEGASSFTFFAKAIVESMSASPSADRNAGRLHTAYDPELGWANRLNARVPGAYGPGKDLRTNAQGFRGARDVAAKVPAGKVRIACSGDSYTFGVGVEDADTWVAQLSTLAPRLETVNLGVGGYGVDQAYLRYLRDGRPLAPDMHIFAFISDDFRRMLQPQFFGRSKPLLSVADGRLVVGNVPVPRDDPASLSSRERLTNSVLIRLRTIELLRDAMAGRPHFPVEPVAPVATEVFKSLAETSRAQRSVLVLVYLPVRKDCIGRPNDNLREWLAATARRLGVPFVDLTDDFRKLPSGKLDALYLPESPIHGYFGAMHYTEAGNRFAAEKLIPRLEAVWRKARPDRPDAFQPSAPISP